MYVLEITNINGEEVWFEGPGWYWTDADFTIHGAYPTEKAAITDYAWYVHSQLAKINEFRARLDRPRLMLPPGASA